MATLYRNSKIIYAQPSTTIGPGGSKFTIYIPEDLSQYSTLDLFFDLKTVCSNDTILLQVYHSTQQTTGYVAISGANFGGATKTIALYNQQITQFAGYIAILVTTLEVDSNATFTFSLTAFPKS